MSQQARPILDLSVVAVAALTYGRAVALAATSVPGAIGGTPGTAIGQKVIGIAKRDVPQGQFGDVTVLGTATCEAGAAIALNARVMIDATNRVITATPLAIAAGATAVTSAAANGTADVTGGDPPYFVFGTALQAANAAGDLIEVLIVP